MRVGRGWGITDDDDLDYGGALRACWVFTFTFLMHHSCKFVVLSRLICRHICGFVVQEEIRLKVSGTSGGSILSMLRVDLMNQYLARQLQKNAIRRLAAD